MNDADEESKFKGSNKNKKEQYENSKRVSVRRASTPTSTELAMVPSHSQWPTYQRIALPLPYLPSDYEPSESSMKQRIFHQDYLHQDRNRITGSKRLQIDSSSWNPKQHQQRPRSSSTGSDRSQLPTNRQQHLSNSGSQDGQKHLELVPYRDWTVISQNELRGNLVLYNPDTRTVTVQTHSPPLQNMSSMNPMEIVQRIVECPYCHRAFDSSTEPTNENQPEFMDRNYFRLLSPVPTQVSTNESEATTNGAPDPNTSQPKPQDTSERYANNLKANAFNQGYYQKFFHEERKLGRGLRGSVYLCEHELDGVNLGHYAVKKVAVGNNHPWLVRMLREVHLMEQLRHPNIVNYKHSWLEYHQFSDFGPEVPCLFILMECANGGNLEEYIEPEPEAPVEKAAPDMLSSKAAAKKSKRDRIKQQFLEQERYEELLKQQEQTNPGKRLLSLYEIWSFFFDMLDGLAHLHRHNIVHRDFKPPNLLIKYDDRDASRTWVENVNGVPTQRRIPRILISDFGECEVLDELPDRDRTGATGTLEFMAPELLRLDDHGKYLQEFSPKADMWSLGMVLFYLCYSRLPYHYVNDIDRLKDEILSFDKVSFPSSRNNLDFTTPSPQDHIPPELKHIIRALLSLNPEARPSCDEILEKIGHLKPKAPNMKNSAPEVRADHQTYISRMRLGNSLGIQGNQSSGQTYKQQSGSNGSQTPAKPSNAISEETNGQGVKIERIPSDMGYAGKLLSGDSLDEVDDDISMDEFSEVDPNNNEGTRKRRKGLERNWNVGEGVSGNTPASDHITDGKHDGFVNENEQLKQLLLESPDLPGDAHQQSQLAMRVLALVPESHRELAEFWMRAATEVDWRKLLKAVSALLKVATSTYPCYPYMMTPTSMYPMVAMALLDMYTKHASQSLALLMLHLAWVIVMTMMGSRTCTMR
ncbi:kinase-like domain-containing protein [Umbelopsis sp. AD052]|nr:kinase-like domain-containing protein [Umbelopsis sp. AD052]